MTIKICEKERIHKAENENRLLRSQLMKALADLEYVAMMVDVDINKDEEKYL